MHKVGHLAWTCLGNKTGIDDSASLFLWADKKSALPVITVQINWKLCRLLVVSSCSRLIASKDVLVWLWTKTSVHVTSINRETNTCKVRVINVSLNSGSPYNW